MKLLDYLIANKILKNEFAALLGVPSSTVVRWTLGERQPRLDAVARIAQLTNGAVTADDFRQTPRAGDEFPACPHLEIPITGGVVVLHDWRIFLEFDSVSITINHPEEAVAIADALRDAANVLREAGGEANDAG